MPDAGLLTVGQVADRCGIAPSAVRYYDDRELIQSIRTEGGQRRFARDTIRRIAFITAAQAVGRSLAVAAELGDGPRYLLGNTAADVID